ncbi:Putative Transcription antitermination protein NusG [endosymbiont DhMRE of Dentiscutata heterogama]|uniref:transcription termination/antitermination protein NusG n=1 Tax=endosymbiont DhMRE of Dentiscutata heterogama TaxID=1609546 RepID=UPI000629D8BE|nr:transcription termination/antitermination NusG family protein [endosymbiont DhMRE of Dentiscutata heterogama]CFW93015.1 Putative Transcription antitermination protein NusG [endosymbiont DhMRE of Dentiscutata heterogama]
MKKTNYQWYILSVRGGREEKLIAKIKVELEKKGWGDNVQELKFVSDNNKKNILKGYLLTRCHLTSQLIFDLCQIPEVIGFLNHQWKENKLPDPVSETVVKNFLAKMKEEKAKKVIENYEKVDFNIGDLVKITEGTFSNREGRITYLDKKKQKVKITIESSGWEVSDVPVGICQKVAVG